MTGQPDDEELHQPRRRVSSAVLTTVAGVVVVGGILVTAVGGDDDPMPRPAPSSAAPTPQPVAEVAPPAALLRAVAAAYPRAELVEVGATVPVRANPDRSYQFLLGPRRITVVIGPADSRPAVETAGRRDVLVVAKRSGRRVVVTVRAFRGTLRPTELDTVRRLVRDARLLATS